MMSALIHIGIKLAVIVGAVAAVVKLYIVYYERRLVFFPVRTINQTPRDVGLQFEWRRFLTYDGHQLTGWWIPHPNPIATLLNFHGNAGNIGDRIQFLAYLHEAGFSVFIFDYRGYGESEGRPTEEGLLMDGDAAYEELTIRIGVPPEQIVFFGRSMGGVIAAHTARGRPIHGIVLEGTFPSALDMAEIVFSPLRLPRWSISVRLDTAAYLKLRQCPALIVHGTSDDVVPYRLGRRLYEMAGPPKEFLSVEGGSHNDCYMVGTTAYLEKLRVFSAGAIDADATHKVIS